MTKLKLFTCAGALISLGALAMAHAGSPADYFKTYDANADGIVTEAEFISAKTQSGKASAAEATEKFMKIAGADGQMTLAELETAMKASEKAQAKDNKDCAKDKGRTA